MVGFVSLNKLVHTPQVVPKTAPQPIQSLSHIFVTTLLAACLSVGTPSAMAVSGGGKDFSGASLENQDLSGKNFAGKEFRGIRGAGAVFKNANLAVRFSIELSMCCLHFKRDHLCCRPARFSRLI